MTDPRPVLSASAVRAGAGWLRGDGGESDVVISSRIRLARNLAGFPFMTRATLQQRQEIVATAQRDLLHAGLADELLWVDVHRLATLERTLLVERHLMSREHAKGNEPRALVVSIPDEHLSIMVNEEDHLRIQVLRSGLALGEALRQIDAADDRIEARLEYAYSSRFGFLTACPTNVGTGIRLSVMLHLPALRLIGESEKVVRAARDMSLAVRGYYGEGSESVGDLYQISNQTTLGKSEAVLRRELEEEILPRVLEYERSARRTLLERRRRALEDHAFRALGLLRHARLLTPEEALTNLSAVRLGVVAGVIPGVREQTVTQLLLLTQPAHLQRALSREMDQQLRREARADFVRQRLEADGGAGAPPEART